MASCITSQLQCHTLSIHIQDVILNIYTQVGMLVTGLEVNQNVPQMDVVTEHLMHEERKLNDRGSNNGTNKVMAAYRHKNIKNVTIAYLLQTNSGLVI